MKFESCSTIRPTCPSDNLSSALPVQVSLFSKVKISGYEQRWGKQRTKLSRSSLRQSKRRSRAKHQPNTIIFENREFESDQMSDFLAVCGEGRDTHTHPPNKSQPTRVIVSRLFTGDRAHPLLTHPLWRGGVNKSCHFCLSFGALRTHEVS